MLMLFTDGLFEVEHPEGELYSQADLLQSVRKHSALPAPQLLDHVLEEIRAFAGRPNFDDDVCVIGIEVSRSLQGAAGTGVSTGDVAAPS